MPWASIVLGWRWVTLDGPAIYRASLLAWSANIPASRGQIWHWAVRERGA